MMIRDVIKMNRPNDASHSRTLFESVMHPEVIAALQDWIRGGAHGVLIGGVGLAYHIRPRLTQDLDFLFLQMADIPDQVAGFKRTRPSAFQHNRTHVEVEVVVPQTINLPQAVAQHVYDTSIPSNGIQVASESGLVALKLFRLSRQDQADIIALVKTGRVDMTGFPLPTDKLVAFDTLEQESVTDPHPA